MRKKALIAYANREGPDSSAHPYCLVLAVSVRALILQFLLILLADNAGPDQPALMRRLIWACVVRKLHKDPFRSLRIICLLNYLP